MGPVRRIARAPTYKYRTALEMSRRVCRSWRWQLRASQCIIKREALACPAPPQPAPTCTAAVMTPTSVSSSALLSSCGTNSKTATAIPISIHAVTQASVWC